MVFTARVLEFGIVQQTLDNLGTNEPAPAHPVPTSPPNEMAETEFLCFFHFWNALHSPGLNGVSGSESSNRFEPTAVPNPRLRLEAVKAAE